MSKSNKIKIVILVVITIVLVLTFWLDYENKKHENELEKQRIETKIKNINMHYNIYVKTNQEADLYILEDDKYIKNGKVGKDVELTLKNMDITSDTDYFMIDSFDKDYYIKYDSVTPIKELSVLNDRYKNYILFNENILTKDKTKFYKDDNLVYELNESFSLPIIIKDEHKFYVEYQNQLLYVLDSEIDSIINSTNSELEKADEIATIAYHFIYDPIVDECDQIICHTMEQVQSHIDYLKSENYFTPTMKEFEMFIDGKILLPKNSVVITVDDGWFAPNARDIFTKNQMNATIFVITSSYDASTFISDYVEVHSHGDNLHEPGVCPTGQGGAIQCVDKAILLEDLKLSREKTFNSTVFCYPFYEYNNYSISVLKEAGFTMAFGGNYAGGTAKMQVGGDKYQIPRFTLLNSTTVLDLQQILAS